MPKNKKKHASIPPYASRKDSDTYSRIYHDLLKSEAFNRLTLGARNYYFACCDVAHSSDGMKMLRAHDLKYGTDYFKCSFDFGDKTATKCYFCFPESLNKTYRFNRKATLEWRKQLIDEGFLELVENNKHRKIQNVYALSNEWVKRSSYGEMV